MLSNDLATANNAGGTKQLTLAMIVRDGGQNLAPLLAGATPWVDEVIIIDTGSCDDSVVVARRHGAQVRQVAWRDDFAWARNQALEDCAGAWILVLDADEQLALSSWRAIREWVARHVATGQSEAANIATRNYLPHHDSRRGWQPVPPHDPQALAGGPPSDGFVITSKVRLFPNRPDVRFRGTIHETVELSLWEAAIPIVDLSVPVHHFGYLAERGDKDERYLHLAHKKVTEQPHDACGWAELAECAIAVGDHSQALVAIERSLRLDPQNLDRQLTVGWLHKETGNFPAAEEQLAKLAIADGGPPGLVAEAAHLRAQIAIQRNEPQQAVPLLLTALRLFPANGHYQNTLGALNLALGRGTAARRALQTSCELLPHQAEPCLNLALLYQNANEPVRARECYAEALRRDPDNQQAADALKEPALAPVIR